MSGKVGKVCINSYDGWVIKGVLRKFLWLVGVM